MGYIKHHAIIVTSWDVKQLKEVHNKAVEIFDSQVSSIVQSKINGYESFFISPDGSKEGWGDSDLGDKRRDVFIDFLESKNYSDGSSSLSYVELFYGEDNGDCKVLRHN